MNKNNYIYVVAATLLAGVGMYYFLFERTTMWWVLLLGGALFNAFLAWKATDGTK